jgi:hypothetical protein
MHPNLIEVSNPEMTEFKNSIDILQQFTEQQDRLIHALLESFPDSSDLNRLSDFPRSKGILMIEGIPWEFHKHGVGFTFTSMKQKIIVNAHKWLANPNFFDACRLSSYLASVRWKGEKSTLPSERQQLYSEKGTKEWLKRLETAGIIETTPNDKSHYRLKAL